MNTFADCVFSSFLRDRKISRSAYFQKCCNRSFEHMSRKERCAREGETLSSGIFLSRCILLWLSILSRLPTPISERNCSKRDLMNTGIDIKWHRIAYMYQNEVERSAQVLIAHRRGLEAGVRSWPFDNGILQTHIQLSKL